jgi:hypothetical protein
MVPLADAGAVGAARWIDKMDDDRATIAGGERDILDLDVADEALEAAAHPATAAAAALSFPSAPTVSILIMCCNNN